MVQQNDDGCLAATTDAIQLPLSYQMLNMQIESTREDTKFI